MSDSVNCVISSGTVVFSLLYEDEMILTSVADGSLKIKHSDGYDVLLAGKDSNIEILR